MNIPSALDGMELMTIDDEDSDSSSSSSSSGDESSNYSSGAEDDDDDSDDENRHYEDYGVVRFLGKRLKKTNNTSGADDATATEASDTADENHTADDTNREDDSAGDGIESPSAAASAVSHFPVPPVQSRPAVISKRNLLRSTSSSPTGLSAHPPERVATPPPEPDILPLMLRARLLWMLDDIEGLAVEAAPEMGPAENIWKRKPKVPADPVAFGSSASRITVLSAFDKPVTAAQSTPITAPSPSPVSHSTAVSSGTASPLNLPGPATPSHRPIAASPTPTESPKLQSAGTPHTHTHMPALGLSSRATVGSVAAMASSPPGTEQQRQTLPRLVDVTMLKWSQLLKSNTHIEALLGVDWPLDEARLPHASIPNNTPTAAPTASPVVVDGSPVAGSSPLDSHPSSPQIVQKQQWRGFGTPPSTSSGSVPRFPAEIPDAPMRTITESAWLEAFRRMARTSGVAAVQRLCEEFSRITRVAREEWQRQQERKAAELEEVSRIRSMMRAGHNRTGSFGALSRLAQQRRLLVAAVAAGGGEVQFNEEAFAGGAMHVDPAKAAQDSIVTFTPHFSVTDQHDGEVAAVHDAASAAAADEGDDEDSPMWSTGVNTNDNTMPPLMPPGGAATRPSHQHARAQSHIPPPIHVPTHSRNSSSSHPAVLRWRSRSFAPPHA